MKTISLLPVAALLMSCCFVSCFPYSVDTVEFEQTGSSSSSKGLVPKTSIDTNISIPGPFGGRVRSHKPYSIAVNHTDLKFTMAAVEFTKVVVTYSDGTTDSGMANLKLPLRINSRHHVAINSGGPPPNYTFETPMRLIVGKIPDVISRDAPVTLLFEGRFIKDNGHSIPFKIRSRYKPVREKGSVSWVDAISSV